MVAATVRLVNASSFEATQNDDTWNSNAQRDSLAGNCYALLVQANGGRTVSTIADNKTNGNWHEQVSVNAGQSAHGLTCTNVAAGTNAVQLVLDAVDTFTCFTLLEMSGISTLTGASSVRSTLNNSGVSTTNKAISAGTFTNNIGDLLIQAAYDVNQNGGETFTPGSGWTLIETNIVHGMVVQYKVATANNETATVTRSGVNGGQTYNTIAMAMIPDSTKGDATQNVAGGNAFPWLIQHQYNAPGAGPAINFQFPCKGNCVVATIWNGTGTPSPISVVSISDSTGSNTWGIPGSGATLAKVSVTNGTIEQWTPGATVTALSMTGTITFSAAIGAAAGGETVFTDWLGAASSPIGASNHSSGTQSVTGNLATTNITPTATFSSSLSGVIINSHCVTLYQGALFHTCSFYDPAADGGEHSLEDDDGVGICDHGASLANQTFTVAVQHNTAGVGTWAAVATEIKVAPAAGAAGLKLNSSLNGLGSSGPFFHDRLAA